MLKLFVHGLGAWFAVEAASGRYPRPLAVGLTMLVSRLGAPATAFAMAGYGLKWLRDAGAFEGWQTPRPQPRGRAAAVPVRRKAGGRRGVRSTEKG